ncbi:hypothetical protein CEXT_16791 [Caerostris extrusa]|uniref:Uncharacterized protein n=1 Tax=Caerostris extrusa TaxID=172846 RepID=A0AAV4NYF8_CAEEX|nr:hypothetical protein CEXT_16791 [Caerostris extrusa]
MDNNSENLQGAVDFPAIPLNNSVSNESQNRRFEEEIELNFACFSGSESSEVDSVIYLKRNYRKKAKNMKTGYFFLNIASFYKRNFKIFNFKIQ